MATTTMGTTPDVRTTTSNKAMYWAVAAALAILLIFAFSANRNDSTVVAPADQVNAPVTTPANRTPAAMESAPAMDSAPANSVIVAPENNNMVSPQSDTINNDGVVTDPNIMMSPSPTGQEPGTSVSPDAPKGTVVR